MAGEVTYNNAINSVALECALRRNKRKCRMIFGSSQCCNCRHYIGNYVDADPRQMNLYMYQADINAQSMRTSLYYINLRTLVTWLFIIGIIAVLVYGLSLKPLSQRQPRYDNTTAVVATIPVRTQSTHQMIETALWSVAKELNGRRDINIDGRANCEDAAILFYMYYPIKDDVRIYANDNPVTGMYHAFNLVLIDGIWRAIEPQAYQLGWDKVGTYFMRDIWGNKYDSSKNVNAWRDYGKYVK